MKDIDSEILQAFRALSDEQKQAILDLLATSTTQATASSGRL